MPAAPVLFLFHREFRLFDNTGLNAIARSGRKIIPTFIFDPVQIDPRKNDYFSNGAVQFMCESLDDLDKQIRKLGSKIVFKHGDTVKVLDNLHKQLKFDAICSHEDNTPFAEKRDTAIFKWARGRDVDFVQLEDYDLYPYKDGLREGKPYAVFSPFHRHCLKSLKVRPVDSFRITSKHFQKASCIKVSGEISSRDFDIYYCYNSLINIHGGRKNALEKLENLKNLRLYDQTRDDVNNPKGTSKLSCFIKFGLLSVREVYWSVYELFGIDHGIIRELHWRSFYYRIAKYTDVLKGKSFKGLSNPKYDKVQWSESKRLLELFSKGNTGFPLIDAAMKNLLGDSGGLNTKRAMLNQKVFRGSNWLHNRLRMLVASFGCKSLSLDYRDVERILSHGFLDYDPASTNGGVQWASGLGSDTRISRTFSPWRQSERHDPEARYIKKWIPALQDVPAKDIHRWSETYHKYPKVNYPKPVIDHTSSVKQTLQNIYQALE